MKRLLLLMAMITIAITSCRKDDPIPPEQNPPEQEVPGTPETPENPEDPDTPDGPTDPGTPDEPEDTTPEIGDYLYADGTWSTTRIEEKDIIGIIYWLGDPTERDAGLKADHPECTHGLAVSLNQKNGAWQKGFEQFERTVSSWISEQDASMHTPFTSTATESLGAMNGYSNTKAIEFFNSAEENAEWKINAGEKLLEYRTSVPVPETTSGWYIPSAKELSLMCSGEFNGNLLDLVKPDIDMRSKLNEVLTEITGAYWLSGGLYWSSSEYNDEGSNQYGWMAAWNVLFEDGDVNVSFKDFSSANYRFVLAF